jgi:hypothetical protein
VTTSNTDFIKSSLLTAGGAAPSSEIIDELVREGIRPEAARKAIQRAIESGAVSVVERIQVKAGARILYLSGMPRNSILEALGRTRSAYGQLIRHLRLNEWSMPKSILAAHTALTLKDRVGRISFDQVISGLMANKLIVESINSFGKNISLIGGMNPGVEAQLNAETIFLETFAEWLRGST